MSDVHLSANIHGEEKMVMVSSTLMESSNTTINAAHVDEKRTLGDMDPGTMIYTAGYAKIKQKGLDGTWTVL